VPLGSITKSRVIEKRERQSAPAFLLAQSPIHYGRVRISSTLSEGSVTRSKACSPVHFEVEAGVCYFEGLAGLGVALVVAAPVADLAVAEILAASPTWEAVSVVGDECERWSLPEGAFTRPCAQIRTKLVVTRVASSFRGKDCFTVTIVSNAQKKWWQMQPLCENVQNVYYPVLARQFSSHSDPDSDPAVSGLN
jgi:hypothetical protein